MRLRFVDVEEEVFIGHQEEGGGWCICVGVGGIAVLYLNKYLRLVRKSGELQLM